MNGDSRFNIDKRRQSATDDSTAGDNSGSPSTGITRLFNKYAEKCSLNGIPYIKGSKSRIVKAAWTLLLLAAIGVLLYHLQRLITSYLEFNTTSKITLSFSSLVFPAVTICNVNAMRYSEKDQTSPRLIELIDALDPDYLRGRIDEWEPEYSEDFENYYDEGIEEEETSGKRRKKRQSGNQQSTQLRDTNFLDDFGLGLNNYNSSQDYEDSFYEENYGDTWEGESKKSTFYRAREQFQELFLDLNRATRARIGHQIRTMLIQCSFGGGKCLQRNFTRVLSETYGNCYTLQYNKFVARRSGPGDGLDLILFLETDQYVQGLANGRGIQLVIHEQGTMPFPDEDGITVAPGTQTNIGLRQVSISRLGSPYKSCTSTGAFLAKYGVKYTRPVCQKVCEQQLIRETCRCYDKHREQVNALLKIPKGFPVCKTRAQVSCVAKVKFEFYQDNNACDCNSPCSETRYEKTISTRQWPTLSFANLLRDSICRSSNRTNDTSCDDLTIKDPSELPMEFINLRIYYEDLNFETLEEAADYELFQFLSDFGGALGLYIGLSVLGIFELIHLLIMIFQYIFAGRWRKRSTVGNK